MADHSKMKLGKHAPRHDARVPHLAHYTSALPCAPAAVDYTKKLSSIGMMLNDTLRDCTCASVGHCIQSWTSMVGKEVILPDTEIQALYAALTGYSPSKPDSDTGAVEIYVLHHWLKHPVAGHKLDAFASIEPHSHHDIKDAIYIFGNCYVGLRLPKSAKQQDLWAVPAGGAVGDAAPDSWGGHAVPIVAYDERTLTCITWGQKKQMTWQFFNTYCEEAYALLSPDWRQANGETVAHFPWDDLVKDIAILKQAAAAQP
jgi:hypothetical protein